MQLRQRRQLRRPAWLLDYGYKNGELRESLPEHARRCYGWSDTKRQKRLSPLPSPPPTAASPESAPLFDADDEEFDELFQDSPLQSSEQEDEDLYSPPPQSTAPVRIQPYLCPGNQKLVYLQALSVTTSSSNDSKECISFCRRGDCVRVRTASGGSQLGVVQDIRLLVSWGTQVRITLRPCYGCRELDPYSTELHSDYKELCLRSPDSCINLFLDADVLQVERLSTRTDASSTATEESVLLSRAYRVETETWLPVEEALKQERLVSQQEQAGLTSCEESEADEEEELESSLPAELLLLKHSFESDFESGTASAYGSVRGFVDALYKTDAASLDEVAFLSRLSAHYWLPVKESGHWSNLVTQLLADLYKPSTFSIEELQPPTRQRCCFCNTVSLCSFSLFFQNQLQPLGRGCAKKLRRMHQLQTFLSLHLHQHDSLSLPLIRELYHKLDSILYSLDRSLKRPIRES